jgi:hypothetical protein
VKKISKQSIAWETNLANPTNQVQENLKKALLGPSGPVKEVVSKAAPTDRQFLLLDETKKGSRNGSPFFIVIYLT